MPGKRDPEQIIRDERVLRDRQVTEYDGHIAIDTYTHSVEDACFWMALDLHPEHTVLDAGCGTGRHIPGLLTRTDRVIGLDHSERSLAFARRRVPGDDQHRVTLLVADLRALPLDDASVDRVMCCEVIQHIPTTERRLHVLREFLRVLRPHGILVVSGYRWLGRVKRHREGFWGEGLYRYAFTALELKKLVASAGFDTVTAGGIAVLPTVSERLGISAETQARIAFTPLGRHLAQYVVARASKA